MNTNTNEKITRLAARSRDKSLTRSERQQAKEELKREKYRTDPRPTISLRKSKLIDGFVFLADAVIFSYMGLIYKKLDAGFSAGDILMAIVSILVIASVFGIIFLHSKYKIEPSDELAESNLLIATRFSYSVIFFVLVIAGTILSLMDPTGIVTIENRKIFYILCLITYLHGCIKDFVFVLLEGKEETEEE
jgi:hypothetical protein